MSPDLPPDLIIFDVDGTLHDTFQWWTPVVRRGIAAFAAASGLDLDLPDDDFAHSVVGMKDQGVWGPFLPASEQHRWRELRATVVPLEIETLGAGRDYLFPGVRELLDHCRENHIKTAIASNCRRDYFAAICLGQGLAAITDWQFCLDSPGIETKTDMLRAAAAVAGAKRPVMVGDREPDQEAARDAGMPFIWRVNSRCELTGLAGSWHGDPDELLAQLGIPRISPGRGDSVSPRDP